LADDEELRRQLAQRAYEFSERFDIKAHVKEIEKIYMELIEGAKGNGRKRKRHFL
jgi:glycosyltransferase involved in cell wall biosynthesis